MKVRIKRIDKSLPLPVYETKGSVAFDISARTDITISPNSVGLIPSNVIIKVPKSHALILAPRSSTPKKHGLSIPHGIGIIDQDYCGSEDEIKIQMFNFTDKPVTVSRGTKIAQGMFVRTDRFDFKEIDDIKDKSRGGFGSTDK
jgi:dUTP pyrophosphatase